MGQMESEEMRLELRIVNSMHFKKVLLVTIGLIALYVPVATLYFGARYLGMDYVPGHGIVKTSADSRLMFTLWFFVFSPVILIPLLFIARRMRVIINESGIYFISGIMNGLKLLVPDWSVRWDELQDTSWKLVPGQYIASRLLFHTKRKTYRISPWHWVEAGARVDSYFPKRKYSKEQAGSILRRTALVEWVRKKVPGYRDDSFYQARQSVIDLDFDGSDVTPLTAIVAVVFVTLVVSFIIEIYFTASEFYADTVPYQLIGLSALLGFLIVHLTLRNFEPERKNSALFALLFGLGTGLAAYPFLVRINTWTDTAGLHGYDYRLDTDYVWRSREPGTPDLDMYLSASAWWRQFHPGDSYTFELREGGLGFWQVNMSPVYEAQKNYRK
jgi:hypothetical protein